MIRGIAEAIGWFIFICALANAADLIEFRLHLNAPKPSDQCYQEQPVPSKQNSTALLDLDKDKRFFDSRLHQLKRDARRLTKTQPLTHSQALEALAKEQGFKNYAALLAAFKKEQQA